MRTIGITGLSNRRILVIICTSGSPQVEHVMQKRADPKGKTVEAIWRATVSGAAM